MADLTVIGGGLAGCEAAWQAARRGLRVDLYEMRPQVSTSAHITPFLAELVCSNSLGSNLPDRAGGLLKEELRRLDSLLLRCAEESAVPAGGALAVDRISFAGRVTEAIESHPNIRVIRQEVTRIPDGLAIIATGPLTSAGFARALQDFSGQDHLYFYDAVAPIVSIESVDFSVAYRASRYGRGDQQEGDYVNCPLNEREYEAFVDALLAAERIELREFEAELAKGVRAGAHPFFEGCLPIEVLAERGREALAFGPLRPVGLEPTRSGRRPYAVAQLRQDDLAGTLYNLVGFQTNLKFSEQQRVFRMIPGLGRATFARYGQMHRNTFINSPQLLRPTLQFREREDLLAAGQIIGVEGYVGNIATGLLAGWNAARLKGGQAALALPETTMLGALCHYVTHASAADFQPMKANFGLLPPLEGRIREKRERARAYVRRSLERLEGFLARLEVEER